MQTFSFERNLIGDIYIAWMHKYSLTVHRCKTVPKVKHLRCIDCKYACIHVYAYQYILYVTFEVHFKSVSIIHIRYNFICIYKSKRVN